MRAGKRIRALRAQGLNIRRDGSITQVIFAYLHEEGMILGWDKWTVVASRVVLEEGTQERLLARLEGGAEAPGRGRGWWLRRVVVASAGWATLLWGLAYASGRYGS